VIFFHFRLIGYGAGCADGAAGAAAFVAAGADAGEEGTGCSAADGMPAASAGVERLGVKFGSIS